MNEGDSSAAIIEKYSKKLEGELNGRVQGGDYSREYISFRQEMIHELSRYERWAKSLGNLIKLRIAEKDRTRVQRFLDISHLDVNASQALTLAVMSMFAVFFATIMLVVGIYLINGSLQLMLGFLGLIASMFIFY